MVSVGCDGEHGRVIKRNDSIRLITELLMLPGEEAVERQSGSRMPEELIAGVSVKGNRGSDQGTQWRLGEMPEVMTYIKGGASRTYCWVWYRE